ncbi:TPA: hypothetical protein ACG0L9_000230 [Enterobacter kobei]
MSSMERDGYILAGGTGVLYLMAYLKNLAEAVFYGVPIEMMSFDFLQLTRGAISVFALVFGILFGVVCVFWLLKADSKKSKYLYIVLMILVMPLVTFVFFRGENETAAFIYSFVVFVLFSSFLFLNKKSRALNITFEKIVSDVKWFLSHARARFFLTGGFIILSLLSAYLSSYVGVSSKNNYNVFYSDGYYAIINSSSDNVIAKKIKNNELGDGFYMFKVEDLNNKEINEVNIKALGGFESAQSNETQMKTPLPVDVI